MRQNKYPLPNFLKGKITPEAYQKWLQRKAIAHILRDKSRGIECTGKEYKEKIHKAVEASNGRDAYTGKMLDWKLMSTYDNEESHRGRTSYKKEFASLPTVDHTITGKKSQFVICAWETNVAKNDMTLKDFMKLCKLVLLYAGYKVVDPKKK